MGIFSLRKVDWLHRLSAVLTAVCAALTVFVVALELGVRRVATPDLGRFETRSQLVTDQDGAPLWAFLADDDRLRLLTEPCDLTAEHLRLLIAAEDQRFYDHSGVDGLAMVRATAQAVRHGEVVSGASTITMQVVRLLEPRRRTLGAKITEMLAAWRLERLMSKRELLTVYLTLTSFGGNVEGVRAGAWTYFGKPPHALTAAEAALLIAVPQSPEARRADREPAASSRAAQQLLGHLSARGIVPLAVTGDDTSSGSLPRPVWRSLSVGAPHLAARARAGAAPDAVIRTTLDGALQAQVQAVADRAIRAWPAPANLAIVVMRNEDASVAAYLGGVDLNARERDGHVNLAIALRSPGSTLKPFIYGLAFEDLLAHPDTIYTDAPVAFGAYAPENFDGSYGGDMTLRRALIRSVNTAAVALLASVGPPEFAARLRAVGAPLVTPDGDRQAGLAIALGGGGMTLEDLVSLYGAIAHDGTVRPLQVRRGSVAEPDAAGGRLFAPYVARALADALADVGPPPGHGRLASLDGGRRIGYKTGTSYGFRDAWAVGFDATHTVGVWIGRPDGAPFLGTYGVTAAAPVMMRVFQLLETPQRDVANRAVSYGPLASPRDLPERLIRFETEHDRLSGDVLSIRFPADRSTVVVDGPGAGAHTSDAPALPLQVTGGVPPYRWFIDGEAWVQSDDRRLRWAPPGTGQVSVSVVDAAGAIARASFWVEMD